MLIYLSMLVALIGLLLYALAANPKVAQCGLIMFGVGLLAFLLKVSEPLISFLGGKV